MTSKARVAWLLLLALSGVAAASEHTPDEDFLEFLGSLEADEDFREFFDNVPEELVEQPPGTDAGDDDELD